jgi:hypothetical protein
MASSTTPDWLLRLHGPPTPKSKTSIPDPPGYAPSTTKKSALTLKQQQAAALQVRKPPTTEEMDALKLKKAWEVALGPAKQLPMNAIGMYMTGNSLQIFSIMMVFMLFKTPITAIIGINSMFSRFESAGNRDKMLLAKIVYLLTNCFLLALGIWKVNQMGLLP